MDKALTAAKKHPSFKAMMVSVGAGKGKGKGGGGGGGKGGGDAAGAKAIRSAYMVGACSAGWWRQSCARRGRGHRRQELWATLCHSRAARAVSASPLASACTAATSTTAHQRTSAQRAR